MKRILLTIIATWIALNGFTQTVHNLTLEESIEIAKEKSLSMLQLFQDMKIAEYNLQSTTSRLKTHITLNLDLPNYEQTIRRQSDENYNSFYMIDRLEYAGSLNISQPLPTDGRIFVETGLSTLQDFRAESRSSLLNTRIGISQPLDILYGYSEIRTALKNARLDYERANKVYKREELALITNVSNTYYRLLSLQKQTEIALANLDRQKEAYEISKNKYEAGLIREVDALQMEVDLADAQSNYDQSVFNQYSAVNSFKELIGIGLNDEVILNNQMTYKIVQVDPEEAVKYAMQNRLELRERDISIEMSKLSLKQQKVRGLPSGTITAQYNQSGANTSPDLSIPNSIQHTYDDFINQGPAFSVAFSVSVPLLDFGENRALVRAAEARLKNSEYQKEAKLREIETSVRNLATGIKSNLTRLQLLEKNVAVAEKSFEITLQRYSDGDIDSQALALERNRLNNAYTSHLNAYIDYQLSLIRLMQETLYDFQNKTLIQ